MSRWKNKGLYISLASLILLVCQTYNLLPRLGLTSGTFNALANATLVFLAAAGVISNPKSGTGYLDNDGL